MPLGTPEDYEQARTAEFEAVPLYRSSQRELGEGGSFSRFLQFASVVEGQWEQKPQPLPNYHAETVRPGQSEAWANFSRKARAIGKVLLMGSIGMPMM